MPSCPGRAVRAASCGAPLMKLPAGPGAPAADAADALPQATAACRGIRTLTAEVAASGKVGGQRFRARLSVGVAAPASARLEAVAPFGPPIFILAANDDDATLLLPRDERVLEHGRSAEVLDAVAGVPLGAADLRAVLTGCAPAAARPEGRAARRRLARRSTERGRRRALPAPRRRRAAVAAGRRRAPRVARRLPRSAERAAAHDAHHQRRGRGQAPARRSI